MDAHPVVEPQNGHADRIIDPFPVGRALLFSCTRAMPSSPPYMLPLAERSDSEEREGGCTRTVATLESRKDPMWSNSVEIEKVVQTSYLSELTRRWWKIPSVISRSTYVTGRSWRDALFFLLWRFWKWLPMRSISFSLRIYF